MIITGIEKHPDLALMKSKMLGSLLYFTQHFYKLRTGNDFVISQPHGRESHHITVCRELMNVFKLETNRLLINIAPGFGKSTFLSYFVAWAFAHYPDCQFMYISYSHELAMEHTEKIRGIMQLSEYYRFFGVKVKADSSAKDNFKTEGGGAVKAFGLAGSITGMNAGLPFMKRFSGGAIIDDAHKPEDVFSDTIRARVIRNYDMTVKPRPRSPLVPIIAVGQMLHEEDLFCHLKQGRDGYRWKRVVLETEDVHGNLLCPDIINREKAEAEKKFNPYVWAAQYQQNPIPAGGAVFKEEWFIHLAKEPKMICTFITVDTAETEKTYNDATVFSFFGLYKVEDVSRETDQFGLHWIDCREMRVEPYLLETEFRSFLAECLMYPTKPKFVAIEKKSTGTTLLSILKQYRGIEVRDIDRSKASGPKTSRYIEMQPYISKRLVSFPRFAKHTEICINQAIKITANNSHAHDDIIDTLYDGVKLALIDSTLKYESGLNNKDHIMSDLQNHFKSLNHIRSKSYQWHP